METLLDNPRFRADYEKLQSVRLNPARHAAATAWHHSEMVVERVADLAALNDCTPDEVALLKSLAYVHDIGKITGTSSAAESVALLPEYGVEDQAFADLVKYHDVNLSWYVSCERGEVPSDKAWRKLARRVNVRLLCLFMVADRVDCPGGWRVNEPLMWFFNEAKKRGLLDRELVLDDGPATPPVAPAVLELSAGGVLVRKRHRGPEALVIRRRAHRFELPKGHVETGERPEEAALRELCEETGLLSEVTTGPQLGTLEYQLDWRSKARKRVDYYLFTQVTGAVSFGSRPRGTRELRWIAESELSALVLVNDELRDIIQRAFAAFNADVERDHES